MSDEMRRRVRKGATLLDDQIPDWYTKIDTNRLEMYNPRTCILGQASQRGYLPTICEWEVKFGWNVDTDYGFSIVSFNESNDDLRDYWIEEINVRLEKASQKRR